MRTNRTLCQRDGCGRRVERVDAVDEATAATLRGHCCVLCRDGADPAVHEHWCTVRALRNAEAQLAEARDENAMLRDVNNGHDLPCGHKDYYSFTEDGGKHIVCTRCSHAQLAEAQKRMVAMEQCLIHAREWCHGQEITPSFYFGIVSLLDFKGRKVSATHVGNETKVSTGTTDPVHECPNCHYTAWCVSAETGQILFCAVCDTRSRLRDALSQERRFKAERDALRAQLAAQAGQMASWPCPQAQRLDAALTALRELVEGKP